MKVDKKISVKKRQDEAEAHLLFAYPVPAAAFGKLLKSNTWHTGRLKKPAESCVTDSFARLAASASDNVPLDTSGYASERS